LRSAERNLLDEKTLRYNQEAIKSQLSHFLDFSSNEENACNGFVPRFYSTKRNQ
jgi:hypothetical protein